MLYIICVRNSPLIGGTVRRARGTDGTSSLYIWGNMSPAREALRRRQHLISVSYYHQSSLHYSTFNNQDKTCISYNRYVAFHPFTFERSRWQEPGKIFKKLFDYVGPFISWFSGAADAGDEQLIKLRRQQRSWGQKEVLIWSIYNSWLCHENPYTNYIN